MPKPQRIRDPLHNLIEFGTNKFEQTLWEVIQTESFQRLRRIKQLGFSEFIYPGATHTRFSHSLGVYYIAKRLLEIVKSKQPDEYAEISGQHALTAALLHDIGHGPFSHAFESVGVRLNLKMAHHEEVSDSIIRDSGSGLKKILDNEFGQGFASNVADLIKAPGPKKIYGAVVSSQFDADRLDYMQRDRLMAGTHLAGIDFSWLVSNLEIGEIPCGVDDSEQLGTQQTFVVGPKAIHAAESYVLALFQLYPTVYFHKTTRGFEKLFTELLVKFFSLVREESLQKTNLPEHHPLVRFARDSDSLSNALALDDTVITGALPLMADAEDAILRDFANRILKRKPYKCIDVFERIKQTREKDLEAQESTIQQIKDKINNWVTENCETFPRILQDNGDREPYKSFQVGKGPLNQIMARTYRDGIVDIRELSPAIAAIPKFEFYRVYYREDDSDARDFLEGVINTKVQGA